MAEGEVFVIVEIKEVIDPAGLQAYQEEARKQLRERGGLVLGRGGVAYEGDDLRGAVLIQRWPSEAVFREWQASEAYRPLLERRRKAVKLRLLIVPAA